jgi:hypothetical protein
MPGININSVMKLVYVWMGLGLLTTAFVAWFVASNDALLDLASGSAAGIVSLVALFGVVIALSAGINARWMTANLAAGLFFVFAGIMGFSLSITLFAFISPTLPSGDLNPWYDPTALYAAFGTAAALFGSMTLVGFTTKMDLTKMGTYLFVGLIGLVIAMFVNMLLGSETLGFLISIVGVIIFTALTAYDTQKIMHMSQNAQIQSDGNLTVKFSIMGALTLYLDFINLFLFLLRIFAGGNRD